MAFNMALSWTVAAAAVGMLIWMGLRNRRDGYQRHRTDVAAEIAYLWATETAKDRGNASPSHRAGSGDSSHQDHSADLIALGAFTGTAQHLIAVDDQTAQSIEATRQHAAEQLNPAAR